MLNRTSFKMIMIAHVACGVLAVAGCKISQPVQSNALIQMPKFFEDTLGQQVRVAPAEIFFSDTMLRSLIDTALKYNQDLLASAERIKAARARLYIAGASALPSLNMAVSGSVDKYGEYTMNGVGNFDTNLSPNVDNDHRIPVSPTTDIFLGLRSDWEIDVWGKLKDRRNASNKRFLASQMAQQWLKTQITAQVAKLYFELQELDSHIFALDQNRALQMVALNIVHAQVDAGRSTALASHQFEARLKHTQADIHITMQRRVVLENELNLLLGRYPTPILRSVLAVNQIVTPLNLGLPADLLLNRPDIREAELELAAANADVNAARKAFFPSFKLNAYAGANSFKSFQLFLPGSLAYGLLGGITAPIFNQRKLKGSKNIAEATRTQAFHHYQKKVLTGYKEVYTAMKSLDNYQQAYQSKKSEVAVLDTAVSAASELYINGYASYLEVIEAQRNVLSASLETATIKKQILFNVIDLYRFTGGG